MTSRIVLWTLTNVVWFGGCQPGAPPFPTAQPSAICYNLQFGKWSAGDSTTPFATAPMGLHTPLPQIIALTGKVSKTASNWPTFVTIRPAYVAMRRPQDADQLSGTWATIGRDSVYVVFPLFDGSALRMRLIGPEQGPRGEAWISPKVPASARGSVMIDYSPFPAVPWADVAAAFTQCPDSLGVVRAGA